MIFSAAVLALAVSCASTSDSTGFASTRAVLRGMVYNTDRLPVVDVNVSVLDKGRVIQTAVSDIHGRYALPEVSYGAVTLQFTKDGYEPLTWSFGYKVPSQIVYVQMSNLDELIEKAADEIQKQEWTATNSFLVRIRKLDPQNRVAAFLEAEMLIRQGHFEEASAELEKLSSGDQPSLATELALADLYQAKLNRPELALVHLRKALTLREDADVRARMAALETTP
jgi:tetratricopeptide (TPR) repeat protein